MSEMRSESDPTAVLPRRIAAFIIDTIILGVFASVMLLPGLLFIDKGDVNPPTDVCVDPPGVCFMSSDNSQVFFADTGNAAAAVLLPVLLWLLMHVVLQGLTGATPGKALMGLRTVTGNGFSVAGIGRALTRALPAILVGLIAAVAVYFLKEQFNTYRDAQVALGIPALAVLGGSVLSLAIALLTGGNRGIGDRIAKTAVIGKQFLGQTGLRSADSQDESVDASAAIAGATGATVGGAAVTAWDIPDTPAPQAPLGGLDGVDPSAGNSFPPPPSPDITTPTPENGGLFAAQTAPTAAEFDPTLPDTPIPDMPDMPAAPPMPETPGMPTAPEMPTAADPFGFEAPSESFFDPTQPEVPTAPGMPAAPGVPSVPDMPAAPPMPAAPSGVPADPFDQKVSTDNPFDVAPPEPEPSILDSFGTEPEPVHDPVDMDADPFASEAVAPVTEPPAFSTDGPTPMADAAALPADPFDAAPDPFAASAIPPTDPFAQDAGVPAADPFATQPDPAAEAQAAQQAAQAQAAEAQAAEQQAAAEAAALQQQQAEQQAAQQQTTQQAQAGAGGPQWDDARDTYIQWDPVLKAWMQWDQPGGRWIPIRT